MGISHVFVHRYHWVRTFTRCVNVGADRESRSWLHGFELGRSVNADATSFENSRLTSLLLSVALKISSWLRPSIT